MAKKSKSRKKSKTRTVKRRKMRITPAETSLQYLLPGDGNDVYINLADDLSKVNRRGYRSGMIYAVAAVTLRQNNVGTALARASVTIKTLPTTWVACQAYMKARDAWLRQQRTVRRETGQVGIKPAYEDFKIYMDNSHRGGTTLNTLDGNGAAVAAGEWDYSSLVYADQTVDPEVVREVKMHMIGPDVVAAGIDTDVGLIQAYEESRATVDGNQPNVPGPASDNIYTLLTAGADDGAAAEIIENMESQNDSPPYAINNYAGGDSNYPTNVDKCFVNTSISNPVVTTPGFGLIAGLMRVFSQGYDAAGNPATIPVQMIVHLSPGSYKGVGALPVGDLT